MNAEVAGRSHVASGVIDRRSGLHHNKKQLSSLTAASQPTSDPDQAQLPQPLPDSNGTLLPAQPAPNSKKSKKKNNNVWVSKSARKGKKKTKPNTNHNVPGEDKFLVTPVTRFPDKTDDTPT
ncbi:hypothetical protein M0R45_007068 [Rubus argutus]|uniref:Uncharacterized protein n=1 Tax=Rubus argutus TaxID=59490 RepID=A0AAW1YSE6_RUBAR